MLTKTVVVFISFSIHSNQMHTDHQVLPIIIQGTSGEYIFGFETKQ